MDDFMQKKKYELQNIRCNNYLCNKQIYVLINKINNMKKDLEELKRVEDRLRDLDSYLNNNNETLKIMKNETEKNNDSLNNHRNNFSVESYQLDELNNNKNNIEKQMDSYLSQLKKMFYIICALIFVYYIVISFKQKYK
jgi:chromosome segregation ATPase